MQIIVFEDRQTERLFPITIGRPAYLITCGSFHLLDRLKAAAELLGEGVRCVVRPHLQEVQQTDDSSLFAPPAVGKPTLLVNARAVPSHAAFSAIVKLAREQKTGVVRTGNEIAAIVLPGNAPPLPGLKEYERFAAYLDQSSTLNLPLLPVQIPLFMWPHDVVRSNMELLGEGLTHRIATREFRETVDGVFVHETAKLGEFLAWDTSKGPIVIDRGASVGPYTFMRGPAYVGPNSRIIEHSAIKDAVSIGHTVKIGGEVEATVIEPFTNKQHHGFLGHSYLGSWINLGAGTCNSDLKNTYGTLKMDYRGEQITTNMQFLGCIIGDYAKSAINTGIFTGKTIGACSMMYGFVTTNVPSFVNYARLFNQTTELTPDVMIATQQRMFLRRNIMQRPCDIQLLHTMYEITKHERRLANEPLAL